MFENPRRGRQVRNFTTNVSKILDLKSSSEQIFFRKLSLGAPDACRFWDFVMLYVGETGRCPDMKHSYCCLRCMCINNLYSGLAIP